MVWAFQHPHIQKLNQTCFKLGHSYVNKFIKNSTGDLLSVFKLLALAVNTQINQVHESIGRDSFKSLVNLPRCFIPLLGNILKFACKEFLQKFNWLKKLIQNEPCLQTLTIGVGIPCAHKIAEKLEKNGFFYPADFHLQWNLKYNAEITLGFFILKMIK